MSDAGKGETGQHLIEGKDDIVDGLRTGRQLEDVDQLALVEQRQQQVTGEKKQSTHIRRL